MEFPCRNDLRRRFLEMTFFRSSKHQRLLWSLLLLSVGTAAGFGLGIFCGAEPPVGCRESDLTPVPDKSFVSPALSLIHI